MQETYNIISVLGMPFLNKMQMTFSIKKNLFHSANIELLDICNLDFLNKCPSIFKATLQ